MELNSSHNAVFGYIYKVILSDNTYWILSCTQKTFQEKVFSKGKHLQNIKNISKIELIQYVSSNEERKAILKKLVSESDNLCLNHMSHYASHSKRELTEKMKKAYISRSQKVKIKNQQNKKAILDDMTRQNKFQLGTIKVFNSVEELMEWEKHLPKNSHRGHACFNWESQTIKDLFTSIFNCHYLTKHEYDAKLHLKFFSQSKIEFWLERGFSLEEATKHASDFQQKGSEASKAACYIFGKYYFLLKDKYKCFIHQKVDISSHEYYINDGTNFYIYDFCILDKKLIFEYNGSHVHANPNWSKDKLDSWRHAFSKESAYVNIENFNKKIKAAETRGFKVFIIWDEDPSPEKTIESILKKEKC